MLHVGSLIVFVTGLTSILDNSSTRFGHLDARSTASDINAVDRIWYMIKRDIQSSCLIFAIKR